jgi:hypothetical protein
MYGGTSRDGVHKKTNGRYDGLVSSLFSLRLSVFKPDFVRMTVGHGGAF